LVLEKELTGKMETRQIHIKGLVQGVGFRPFVCNLANELGIRGRVNNATNGVHIIASAEKQKLDLFFKEILSNPPVHAIITDHQCDSLPLQNFDAFQITESEPDSPTELLITPDLALCETCKKEMLDSKNRRYRYPFSTCTHCGPRYSILQVLPYDRENTSMYAYAPCAHCKKEYASHSNRRYYSQTNSCPECEIPMHLYNSDGELVSSQTANILLMIKDALRNGHILAVKGIGGYLLLADATNHLTVHTLRKRKQRPCKPLAVLYPSPEMASGDVDLQADERETLQSAAAPIVICKLREKPLSNICTDQIAPGLNSIGVMIPYAPLLALISSDFGKPLIATSGNSSGSSIVYDDETALELLTEIADFVVTYDREITVPQDDSVVQFSPVHRQKIILRRSRGLAPFYFPAPFKSNGMSVLAMGAEHKSSFSIVQNTDCYVSQYLGNQISYDAQLSFKHTLQHFCNLIHFKPDICLADKHPNYLITEWAKKYAAEQGIPLIQIQHHEAHFAAVLAENNLLRSKEPVLGVVWDGAGLGTDKNIWGGEFFVYATGEIKRIGYLDYFPVLLGDKMAKEPRLSALSLCFGNDIAIEWIRQKFTTTEWNHYINQLRYNSRPIFTSSIGRLLDAVASITGVSDYNTFEGEAAMKLEALAQQCTTRQVSPYTLKLFKNIFYAAPIFHQIIEDLKAGVPVETIAFKMHRTLAGMIERMAIQTGIKQIACSGGVFQNALLVDLIKEQIKQPFNVFFHRQLAPNDECISFGQLAHMQLSLKNNLEYKLNTIHH